MGFVAELGEPVGDTRVLVQRDRRHLGGEPDQVRMDVAPDLVVDGVAERATDLCREAGHEQRHRDQPETGHQRRPDPGGVEGELHTEDGQGRQHRTGDGGETEQGGRPRVGPEAGRDPQADDAQRSPQLGHRSDPAEST